MFVNRWLAGVVALASLVPAAGLHAETATVCGQKVDYAAAPPDPNAPATLRALPGVWEGDKHAKNSYSLDYMQCVGFVVERVAADGTVVALYAAGATQKFIYTGNVYYGKPFVGRWDGKTTGNTLRFISQKGTAIYEFPLSGSNRMEGRITDAYGAGTIWLKKR